MSKDCECASAQGNTLSILDCDWLQRNRTTACAMVSLIVAIFRSPVSKSLLFGCVS
jgi:hypothetical protein